MCIAKPGLAAILLLIAASASSEPLAQISAHIEKEHQIDTAVCKELSKEELRPCLKEAQDKKNAAYAEAWKNRDPAQQTRIYYGDLNANKPKIEKDYKADIIFCKALDKAGAATCQREALARKKLAIRSIMTEPKEFKPACPTCGTVTAIRELEKPGLGVGSIVSTLTGNSTEKRSQAARHYDITFKLSSGEEKTIRYTSERNDFKVGDKIRYENNLLNPE